MANLYPQALAYFVFPSSDTEPNSTIVLFIIGSYVHSYKFEICVHNSLQTNGMVPSVVKILAAGVRRAMNSDVLASVLSMQFGKFQRILKSFKISVNISSFGKDICCAVEWSIWHRLSRYAFIHIAGTIHSVTMIMYLHYYYYYYSIYQCA